MKKILFLLSFFSTSLLSAQTGGGGSTGINPKIMAQIRYIPTSPQLSLISCEPVSLNGCNYIPNNNFTPSVSYNPSMQDHLLNPFEASPFNLVPGWAASHGTPQITDGIYDFANNTWLIQPSLPPSPATGYAYGVTIPDAFNPFDEGFARKIPNLVQGRKYLFSFFDKLQNWGYSGLSLESYNIILMHCADAVSVFTYPGINTPTFPVNSQKIVCHNNVTTNWQRFTTSFVANDDYDVIVFYPKNEYSATATAIGVSLAYPELIDVQDFSAGSNPTPTPPNCIVIIGPTTPNCSVANAVFTWTGPSGQSIIAPANQQIQVDASDPLNVGTWTLTMTVSNSLIPNGICTQLQTPISAIVNVPSCGNAWPKVYYCNGTSSLTKGNNGNIFTVISPSGELTQNYNHIGAVLPPVTNMSSAYTMHYTSGGVTNYYKEGSYPSLFVTSSGVVQSISFVGNNPVFSYFDENSGNAVSNPPSVPFNEVILCETNNGGYITRDNSNIYYRSSTANFSVSISWGVRYFRFNKVTGRLFIEDGLSSLKIYDLGATSFIPVASSPNSMGFWFVLIDNYDRVFVNKYDGLKLYDIYSNTFTAANINGLPSNTSFLMHDNSPYTSNEFLTNVEYYNPNFDRIYYVNVSANNQLVKYMNKSGDFYVETYRYLIENGTIFIANNFYSTITMGGQTIQQLPLTNQEQIFIAKFDLTDFQSFQANSDLVKTENKETFKLSISPNPITNNILNLRIFENDKLSLDSYTVLVTNKMGWELVQKNSHFSDKGIDISRLEKGVYFVTVINRKAQKVTAMFSKL